MQLEMQINQKIQELNESLRAQALLRERLVDNTRTLWQIETQLKEVEAYLTETNDTINVLTHENQCLKLSSQKWMQRAIDLEFKLLSAIDSAKHRP